MSWRQNGGWLALIVGVGLAGRLLPGEAAVDDSALFVGMGGLVLISASAWLLWSSRPTHLIPPEEELASETSRDTILRPAQVGRLQSWWWTWYWSLKNLTPTQLLGVGMITLAGFLVFAAVVTNQPRVFAPVVALAGWGYYLARR